ncbi:hypothetical protein PG989_012411 [Apiospora arundinis]|uniref:Secondary metabolism biosynthetic enzyme n=1 Tax=Apiospora arundinis TaxID=335852 RepID=A0ABR2IHN8_9PEZI
MHTWECLQDVLEQRAKSDRPGRLLVYPLGNTHCPVEMTYTSLFEEAKRLSRSVRSRMKLEPGHPVLLHFDDHLDIILWFWAILLAGGIPVLSPPFSNVEEDRRKHIESLSTLLESPFCFTRSKFLDSFGASHHMHLHPIEDLLQNVKGNNCDHNEDNETLTQCHDRATCSFNHKTAKESGGGDLAMLMLTSGSTGNAKAVQFTHEQILAAVSGKAGIRQVPLDRPFLNWVGLDHVAGLIETHLQALWLGIDQVHVSAADVVPSPAIFLDLLSRHRVSRTFAPNFFLARLASVAASTLDIDVPSWDLSSLTCVTSGGEANDLQTCMAASALLEKHGAGPNVITPGFGMTETCAGAIFNLDCPGYEINEQYVVASLGKCMDGIEMRITTISGAVAQPKEAGELEVRGPVVTSGYYRNRVATDQAFTPDGWFRTGDRGMVDSSGNLNLVGRAKDVININGVKMASADIQSTIEQALSAHVERLVVFPSTASHTEQVAIGYVPKRFPLKDEEVVEIARLATKACLVATSTSPLIFALQKHSLPLLPTSTLGKISRLRMARLFADGWFAQDVDLHIHVMSRAARAADLGRKDEPMSEAEARLMEDVARTLDTTPESLGIHIDTCIFDIGFTSMHVIKLKYYIEKRLGTNVSVFQIMKNPTIRSLVADLGIWVRESKARSLYDPIVVFQERGSKPPLWLFHPGVGEVLVFVGLAQRLAQDDRPVYALRAAGFEANQPPFSSIEQAVELYTTAIRKTQPTGPYALAGYSYGTMLAFETAKQLTAGGQEVRFLGSFNLPPHIKSRISQLSWNVCLLHLAHFLGLVTEDVSDTFEVDPAFRALPRTEAMEKALELFAPHRMEELGLNSPALARWVDVAYGLQSIAMGYDPSGEVHSIDVFHAIPLRAAASSREVWLKEHLSRWSDFVREKPRFHAVGGAHYTMIGPEHVGTFAETLTKALKERGI